MAVREIFDDDDSIVMEQDDDESIMPPLIYRAVREGEEGYSDDDDFSLPEFCQREDDWSVDSGDPKELNQNQEVADGIEDFAKEPEAPTVIVTVVDTEVADMVQETDLPDPPRFIPDHPGVYGYTVTSSNKDDNPYYYDPSDLDIEPIGTPVNL